ncbi:hypothetical protein Tco_1018657 [Tanacetum coccineum]|uniref:Aminotransferase-like plant mobile domain-containing protein n=1 Tax=Tanacetum coccineum TaxID=301880 RepID=A0ABQ5FXH1_9ASTR
MYRGLSFPSFPNRMTSFRGDTFALHWHNTFAGLLQLASVVEFALYFRWFHGLSLVPEIFMQQFWTILDIRPRVEGVDFTNVPDDDIALTFLIDLGYKGALNKHTNMLKFFRIGEDYQEYGLAIPDVMLNDTIKLDVSKESELELEPVKKKTASRRMVKKKVTLSAEDNIIYDNPDAALELGKSISLTEFEEAESARKVFCIWKAFGRNTRDLGSFGEETDKTTNLHQHLSRISTQKLETASPITRDAVTTHLKTASQYLQTVSDCMTRPII